MTFDKNIWKNLYAQAQKFAELKPWEKTTMMDAIF